MPALSEAFLQASDLTIQAHQPPHHLDESLKETEKTLDYHLFLPRRWNPSIFLGGVAACHLPVEVNLIGLLHVFLYDDSSSCEPNVTLSCLTHIPNPLLASLPLTFMK